MRYALLMAVFLWVAIFMAGFAFSAGYTVGSTGTQVILLKAFM